MNEPDLAAKSSISKLKRGKIVKILVGIFDLLPLPKLQRGKLIPNSEALIVGNMIGIYCLAIEVSIILGDGCLFVI